MPLEQRKKAITEYSIDEILLWIMGFFSPMLLLYFAGNSVFLYSMLVCTAWCGFNYITKYRGEIKLLAEHRLILVISALTLVSITVCLRSSMENYWKEGESVQYIWTLMYLIFFLYYSLAENRKYVIYYIKGVIASTFVQILWSIVQFVLYIEKDISLNDVVFGEYLHMENAIGKYSSIRDSGIAVSGICWHPSNMAPLLVIGYCFTKNRFLKAVMIVIAFITASRTALLGMAICVAIDIINTIINSKMMIKANRWIVLLSAVIVIAAAIYFICINTSLIDRIKGLLELYSAANYDNNASNKAHMNYWLKTPDALRKAPMMHVLFGYGPNCSGYMTNLYYGLNQYPGLKWVLECDYMDCLWSTGVLGFAARYALYLVGSLRAIKKDKRLLPLVVSFAIMGVTYNFICTWCLLFVYCVIIYWGIDGKEKAA